jgi:CubicO group peptidase (beta-lactamase class C family)
MSRADRGRGPAPRQESRIQRYILGRERHEVRARFIVASLSAAVASAGLALLPHQDLRAPMLAAISAEAPNLPVGNIAALVSPEGTEPKFETVEPALAGLEASRLGMAATAVRQELRRGAFPGATLVVGRGSNAVQKQGFGTTHPGGKAVDPDETLYDLASLTKVIATTAAVMLMVEDGRMELDAPVSRYLPEFTGGAKARVTVRQLLTHTSGLPAGVGLPGGNAEATLRRIIATPLKTAPGERVVYSDVGPVVLMAAAERAAGESAEDLLARRVFKPLGMSKTGFRPDGPCAECAPTARTIHGSVHDPIARRLGGVAGNAGLFATASDVGRFAAMLANGGELEGVRIFSEETVRDFTRQQRRAGTRALGWDTANPRGSASGGSQRLFGHTGYTGTSLWVDPARGTWAVLLTNRTFAAAPNRMQALRRAVNERVAEAADLAAR